MEKGGGWELTNYMYSNSVMDTSYLVKRKKDRKGAGGGGGWQPTNYMYSNFVMDTSC